jgi:hypothetical protein
MQCCFQLQGNLTGDQYIRDVLQPVVVPHFDNHPLATRPVYMDDNARPRRSKAVTAPRARRTASSLHLIPQHRCPVSCCDSSCHSRCNAAFNWQMFCTGGSRACIRRPNMSQICSMGFKSGLMAGQGTGRHPSTWGYPRYWTLSNTCRQVIHKCRFESEMTILSWFLNWKVNT